MCSSAFMTTYYIFCFNLLHLMSYIAKVSDSPAKFISPQEVQVPHFNNIYGTFQSFFVSLSFFPLPVSCSASMDTEKHFCAMWHLEEMRKILVGVKGVNNYIVCKPMNISHPRRLFQKCLKTTTSN